MAGVTQRRAELYGLLGELPDRDRPIGVTTVGQEQREPYVFEKPLHETAKNRWKASGVWNDDSATMGR